jgi:hypothetical protein
MQGLKVLPAGTWDSSRAVDSVLIDREAHHSGRMLLRTTGNRDVVVDVTHTALRPGDGLELDNGGVIQVHYAPDVPTQAAISFPWLGISATSIGLFRCQKVASASLKRGPRKKSCAGWASSRAG